MQDIIRIRKPSFLLLILILSFLLSLTVASTLPYAHEGDIDRSKLTTNAARLKAGLGPMKPKSMLRATRVKGGFLRKFIQWWAASSPCNTFPVASRTPSASPQHKLCVPFSCVYRSNSSQIYRKSPLALSSCNRRTTRLGQPHWTCFRKTKALTMRM